MNDTVLFDKLLQLRLPAFREGLREQQANPKYTELSFEERLALLVEQECTRRHNNRIRRSLRTAAFPMQAALEDLDLTPERGLDRRQVLELGQCAWIGNHLNILVLGPTGGGKASWLVRTVQPRSAWAIQFATFVPRACCIHSARLARTHLTRPYCARWHGPICSFWMIGCGIHSLRRTHKTSWKSWMIATATPRPS